MAFDFRTDAIVPRREGAHLYATGTTLGSDNGIGVATMLAVMESTDLAHGPLELLFTIDEETGLTGAAQLDASLLAGRRADQPRFRGGGHPGTSAARAAATCASRSA